MNLEDPQIAQAIAFAGLCGCANAVNGIATGHRVTDAQTEALLQPVLNRNPDGVRNLFPKPDAMRPAVRSAINQLSAKDEARQALRYTVQLIELSNRLRQQPAVVNHLGQLIDALPEHAINTADADDVQATQPDLNALADIYQKTISTLGKRIQVTGDPAVLQLPDKAGEIRAFLLAGVRFAWLWQQLGGKRWHVLLRRNQLLVALTHLLEHL